MPIVPVQREDECLGKVGGGGGNWREGNAGEEELSKRGWRASVLSTGFAIWGELNPFVIFGVFLFSH